jgi:tetratricopeptide (TPR) repeat protein
MAGKVNTKFVVLLSVGLVAVFGLLAWAFASLAFKSGDDYERLGDQAMQEGDFFRAQRMYGSAVSHDTTNRVWLDKWITALESWTPDTETAYKDAFFTRYLPAISQIATSQRTDIGAHGRLLGMYHDILLRGYNRDQADTLATLTRTSAAYFDRLPDSDAAWRTLLRYRGLAMEMVLNANGVLADDQVALIAEDLRAALEADPSDGESMAALMRWTVANAARDERLDTDRVAQEARRQARDMGLAFLNDHPGDPYVELATLQLTAETEYFSAQSNPDAGARVRQIMAAYQSFGPELDRIADLLREAGPERIGITLLSQMRRIESAIDGAAQLARTRSIVDSFLTKEPEATELLLFAAESAQNAGDLERASSLLETIGTLPAMPVSFDGLIRYQIQRTALITRAGVVLDLHQRLARDDTAGRAAMLDTARQLRTQYAAQVSEDNLPLMLLDGRLAATEDRMSEALRLFRRYNELSQNQSPDARGLMLEARAALQLGQSGTAQAALERLLVLQPTNVEASLMMFDLEVSLREYAQAEVRMRNLLQAYPTGPIADAAQVGLQRLAQLRNPSQIEDPVIALLTEASQTRFGSEGVAADPAAAARLLEANIDDEKIGYDPRVAGELASMRVDMGDLAGARAIVAESLRRFPEDQRLARMSEALGEENVNLAVVKMLELSGTDEIQTNLAIASVALPRGLFEEADKALARLAELAPENPRYIELAFIRALQTGDQTRATALAAKAEQLDLDRVRGLTYRARQASVQGQHADAVSALRQATALGTADAGVFRLLGMELRTVGRLEEATQAFEQALQIRPDDTQTIFEYVRTLTQARRFPQALDVARRYQRFGLASPDFVELWLNLEAEAGGDEGLARAVNQRERLLEINPTNRPNRGALAMLYMTQKRWPDAKVLLDQLRAEGDQIELVEMAARWNADQGRVGGRDGLVLARETFLGFIEAQTEPSEKLRGYLTMARFMNGRGRPDLAVAAVDQAIAFQDPATMSGTKFKGELLMSLSQNAGAAAAFKEVVDAGADTEMGSYRERLAEMYIRLEMWDEAAEQIAKLPASATGTLTNLFQRAEIAGGRGEVAEQRRILDEAASKFPQDPMVFVKRAQAMIGDPALRQDLLSDIETALRLSPNDWRALRVRAAANFQDDRRAEAVRDLREAVRQNPGMDDAVFGVINEYLNSGQPGEAAAVAREVLDRRSQDAPLMYELGRLFESRELYDRSAEFYGRSWAARQSPGDGAKYIDMLLRKSPPDPDAANGVINALVQGMGINVDANAGLLAAQALVLRARGREDFALQQMTKAFDVSLKDESSLFGWASNVARFYLGMSPQSELDYYRRLRATYADPNAQAWIDLMLAYRRLNHGIEVDQAEASLRQLGGSTSTSTAVRGFAWRQLGNDYYAKERFADAIDAWEEALALAPQEWDLNNNIAFVMATKLGQAEQALPLAEKALEADPSRSEPYDTLASIYTALKKFSEAEQMLEEGDRRARTYGARVSLSLTRAKLELAKGNKEAARASLATARSILRGIAGRDALMEAEIESIEGQIGSEG